MCVYYYIVCMISTNVIIIAFSHRYNVVSVKHCVGACIGALLGADLGAARAVDSARATAGAQRAVAETVTAVRPYWPGL